VRSEGERCVDSAKRFGKEESMDRKTEYLEGLGEAEIVTVEVLVFGNRESGDGNGV
jgi:hypothetical protein